MDAILVFDLIHHESASQRAQAIDRSQHVQDKFLIVLHIGSVYLEQIVIVAGYVIALRDLRDILDDPGKFRRDILVQPGQSHATKHDETLIQRQVLWLSAGNYPARYGGSVNLSYPKSP